MSTIVPQSNHTLLQSINSPSSSSQTYRIPISPISPAKPLSLRIPDRFQRSRITYAEPPPVPPSQDQSYSKRKPNHVPIVISEELKAAVQRALPDSPETGDESPWKHTSFAQSIYYQRSSNTIQKPKHIPIVIPDFAQPYNPFPPSPPLSSGESTPKESKPNLNLERFALPMRTTATPTGPHRPSTADSTASLSLESLQLPNNHSQASLHNPENNVEPSPPTESQRRPSVSEQQLHITESMAAVSASQQALSGTTNLSGLMCNVHHCTGKEPHGLVGATTTIVGDKLFVFGGKRLSRRRPQLTSDLYELDLIRRHWVRVETTGDIPPPRYFHSVCAVGDSKLVCYGGMSPAPKDHGISQIGEKDAEQPTEVIVMSDVHIYDIASQTWELIKTKLGGPQGRYAHCATVLPSSGVFTSAQAPISAIKHNASSNNPNEGALGYAIDGTGGAEMIVVGGQDSANSYIEQISVFNLRSMDWVSIQALGRSCGAYRSVVAPLNGMPSSHIGDATESKEGSSQSKGSHNGPSSMLIYSNYNFLDVKLELQVRQSDGSLIEKSMGKQNTPPGLRFPSGGVLDNHFLISGTFLTSTKQEYALWALNLKTLTWTRVDAGNSIFSQGSWNRGILWPRRNTFVILGNRKRNLIEDYNHRRINFANICLVELEAFGYYDNPRSLNATSTYSSASAPAVPQSVRSKYHVGSTGGRPHFTSAEDLGLLAVNMKELADMEIECLGGDRIPANSHILSRRWGPYFVHAMRNGASSFALDSPEDTDTATLRAPGGSIASRNSSITITPSIQTTYTTGSGFSGSTKINDSSAAYYPPTSINLVPTGRSRVLYMPHTPLTIHALLHFLYTSSLPSTNHPFSTPQILCSLLQIARPYCVDGLLEAVVERLHQVTDGRNAPAVFNASAMAAGGGRGTAKMYGNTPICEEMTLDVESTTNGLGKSSKSIKSKKGNNSDHSTSDSSSDSSSTHSLEPGNGNLSSSQQRVVADLEEEEEEIWNGDRSCVIGLQKRGLRGLMEGRRLRERGKTVGFNQTQAEI